VKRGGSWNNNARNYRSANKGNLRFPDEDKSNLGGFSKRKPNALPGWPSNLSKTKRCFKQIAFQNEELMKVLKIIELFFRSALTQVKKYKMN